MHRVILIITLFCWNFLFSTTVSAFAENKAPKLVARFDDWDVIVATERNDESRCYTMARPYRTKIFDGIRNLPFFTVGFVAPGAYTITAYPGFLMNVKSPALVDVDGTKYALQTLQHAYGVTYSDTQDVKILNDILRNGYSFSINYNSANDKVAVDFYKTKGLLAAMDYMKRHCQTSIIDIPPLETAGATSERK